MSQVSDSLNINNQTVQSENIQPADNHIQASDFKEVDADVALTSELQISTPQVSRVSVHKTHTPIAGNLIGPEYSWASGLPSPFESLLDTTYTSRLQTVEMTVNTADTLATLPPAPPAWAAGKTGQARPLAGGSDSGLLTIITLLMVVIVLNFKYCPRIFANFADEMLSVRRRANVFDEHTTNETRVLVLMIFEYIAACGLLLYAAISMHQPTDSGHIFKAVTALMGLIGGYYVFQLCAYSYVGYLFTDKLRRQQWLRGFNATQTLAGLALLIPALITLFYPRATHTTLIVAGSIYLLARIIFIAKGFRIFFNKITALFYFILYLCTLEIIPALAVYHTAAYLVAIA